MASPSARPDPAPDPRTAEPTPTAAPAPRRARWPGRSIKRRLVILFLLLAAALAGVFVLGAQRAFTLGWREAARPLLRDYVDRLAADIAGPPGSTTPPRIEAAQALAARLPITVRIDGPAVRWSSHPTAESRHRSALDEHGEGSGLLTRQTADGHRISFGIDDTVFARRQRQFGWALGTVLLITLAAYLVVRRLLQPLDSIRAGAQRFGDGDFTTPIPVRHPQRPDELDQLAGTVNDMAERIRQMLEAKRALLLAISHELRSPLTRARLHVELLPEDGDAAAQRQALLRDLQEMAALVNDLLESERLAARHAVLQREPTDLPALAREVITELHQRHPAAAAIMLVAPPDLPQLALDRARLRLLLRNLLDNALRHGGEAPAAPMLQLNRTADGGIALKVRDHGPGVADEQLTRLAEAFYRPDSARTRAAGGVGLGLYLCRLVAQAHGGRLTLRHARPGLAVTVTLPPDPRAG